MNIVIIGAGKTGRGFLAPLVYKEVKSLTFIDRNQELIDKLRKNSYNVYYYNYPNKSVCISDFEIYNIKDTLALNKIYESDLILTSVYSTNLKSLVSIIDTACNLRNKKEKIKIICCENGVDVKHNLKILDDKCNITEALVFCTTMQYNDLDLISEDFKYLYYDNSFENMSLKFKNLKPVSDFELLVKRKIYTYNFLSALIAYIGYYIGHSIFGEAANDNFIKYILDKLHLELADAISKEYNISFEQQLRFTQNALSKFQNKDIYDTIERNCINVKRKLGPKERLLMPLNIMLNQGKNINPILLVIACALYYGRCEENLDTKQLLDTIAQSYTNKKVNNKIKYIFKELNEQKDIKKINL
ncbi:MAG: 2-dehydropantoate 2-reductase N-terminal domain-containing protein [Tissierellia bacterium]|nr:2-dehydropantoate 2-reductase N-terminal domain-containing protein [Tissierellia bacterium]